MCFTELETIQVICNFYLHFFAKWGSLTRSEPWNRQNLLPRIQSNKNAQVGEARNWKSPPIPISSAWLTRPDLILPPSFRHIPKRHMGIHWIIRKYIFNIFTWKTREKRVAECFCFISKLTKFPVYRGSGGHLRRQLDNK